MKITFVVLTSPRIVGGIASNFYLANSLARLGHDVTVAHVDLFQFGVRAVADISWFAFDERVQHRFVEQVDYGSFPDADFIFVMSTDDGVPPTRNGLPLISIRGYGIYRKDSDERSYHAPYPKVVPARWLVDVGTRMGVPEQQLVLVPNGVDHEKYRLIRPMEGRGPIVAMVYRNHPTKGAVFGLEALAMVKSAVPEVEAVVFGQAEPRHDIAPWIVYRHDPPQPEIVDEIYNGSAVFLSSSVVEGFGKPCIEAMACGCALVTTDNGGSRDYAIDGETALVSPPKDSRAMATKIEILLQDQARRAGLAQRGSEYVKRFDWDTSAETLERFLIAYGEQPERLLGRADSR
ncbi:MAG: glycosyltransferase family 4 protein [Acidimicrobiia bacterium]